ncbi:hypothetical protein I4U23_010561 [Adineta vaga]|nr:hypothetical protein I4U23_010561 [Adineta vaga]
MDASEPTRWHRFFSPNRVKLNLFHLSAIICLQVLCYSVILSIDTYISSLSNTNSSGLYDQIGNKSNNETCPQIDNETSTHELNSQSNQTVAYERNIANSIPSVIMIYALGILMPFVGKRFVLLSCMLGIGIQLLIALAILYLNLSVYWWYMSGFLLGLFGGASIIDFVTYLIIVDITTENNRSLWFVRFYALRKGLEALITFFINWFVQFHGYIALFWCGFILHSIAIVVIWLYFDLSLYNHTNLSGHHQVSLNFDIITIFYGNRRSTAQKITVLFTIIAYCFYSLLHSMSSAFYLALANYPVCWSEMLINIYKLVNGISLAIFSVLGYHLLALLTKYNDELVCAISHAFLSISSLWMAFAQHHWQVFTNSAWYTLANYQNPLTLSILAAWLKPHEINIAFIFIIVINQLITSFGDLFFNWIYTSSSNQHKNIMLFVRSGLCLIPLILNICIYIVKRRMLERSSVIIDERTSLLANANENNNSSDSNTLNNHDDLPISVTLFQIGNLTLTVNITSTSKANSQQTSEVETNQNAIST